MKIVKIFKITIKNLKRISEAHFERNQSKKMQIFGKKRVKGIINVLYMFNEQNVKKIMSGCLK